LLQGRTCGVSRDGGRARALQQRPQINHSTIELSHGRLLQKTDHLNWSLPAHRRGTLRGMDAA
ncbi:hypothetical protein XaraCFBP7407_22715, partial [Xanthomonas arboricola pv. arracaciae]